MILSGVLLEPLHEQVNALFDLDLRMIAEVIPGFGDIGAGYGHIAGLERQALELRSGAHSAA